MKAIPLIIGTLLMVACQHVSSSYIKVYKYDGSVQCGYAGVELDTMVLELNNAGIDVVCSQKGHDGLMRAAVCGSDTGKLNIYVIESKNLSRAEAIGFKSTDSLADYRDQECKM